MPCIVTKEEDKSGIAARVQKMKNEPIKPFCHARWAERQSPAECHETAQRKRILCGSEPLVTKARHKSNKGGAPIAGEILKGNGIPTHYNCALPKQARRIQGLRQPGGFQISRAP